MTRAEQESASCEWTYDILDTGQQTRTATALYTCGVGSFNDGLPETHDTNHSAWLSQQGNERAPDPCCRLGRIATEVAFAKKFEGGHTQRSFASLNRMCDTRRIRHSYTCWIRANVPTACIGMKRSEQTKLYIMYWNSYDIVYASLERALFAPEGECIHMGHDILESLYIHNFASGVLRDTVSFCGVLWAS